MGLVILARHCTKIRNPYEIAYSYLFSEGTYNKAKMNLRVSHLFGRSFQGDIPVAIANTNVWVFYDIAHEAYMQMKEIDAASICSKPNGETGNILRYDPSR
jgi:hypothetical protein